MKVILSAMIMVTTLIIVMLTMLNMISKKSFSDREKNSPFECGFDPKNSARLPFSLQFFLIAVIFVIFDVELVILLPMVLSIKISSISSFMFTAFMFLAVLLTGTYHEWNQGALDWEK